MLGSSFYLNLHHLKAVFSKPDFMYADDGIASESSHWRERTFTGTFQTNEAMYSFLLTTSQGCILCGDILNMRQHKEKRNEYQLVRFSSAGFKSKHVQNIFQIKGIISLGTHKTAGNYLSLAQLHNVEKKNPQCMILL